MGFSINGWQIAGGKQSCEIKGLHQWLYCIITHSDLSDVWSKWDKRSCAQLYEVFISLRLPKKNWGGINQFTFLTVCPIQGHLEAGAYPNHHSVRAGIKSGQPHIHISTESPSTSSPPVSPQPLTWWLFLDLFLEILPSCIKHCVDSPWTSNLCEEQTSGSL